MKKYSVLSIAILAVAAITAAFAPSKSKAKSLTQKDPGQGGILRLSTGGQDFTCTKNGLGNQCDYTITELVPNNSNGRSATSVDTDTISIAQVGDANDTNNGGAPAGFLQSLSTTRL